MIWNGLKKSLQVCDSVAGSSSGNGAGAVVAAANDYSFAQIGSKPTTISGYGITDAFTQTLADARYSLLTHNKAKSSNTQSRL